MRLYSLRFCGRGNMQFAHPSACQCLPDPLRSPEDTVPANKVTTGLNYGATCRISFPKLRVMNMHVHSIKITIDY